MGTVSKGKSSGPRSSWLSRQYDANSGRTALSDWVCTADPYLTFPRNDDGCARGLDFLDTERVGWERPGVDRRWRMRIRHD
jgi:hypothetical protein